MKKDKNEKPTDDAMKGYNPADRDFQRTEEDVDNVSGSEKEALEKKRKREDKTPRKDNNNGKG